MPLRDGMGLVILAFLPYVTWSVWQRVQRARSSHR